MKYLAILLGLIYLTGCSSTPKVALDEDNFCTKESTRIVQDGTTSSSFKETCSDKPNPRAVFENGMDMSKCGWARQAYVLNGRRYLKNVMACQLQDGSWTYVPSHNSY